MADLPSRLDLYALGRQYVLQNAKRIDPTQIDVDGSDVNLFVGSNSVVADTIVKQLGYSVNRLTLTGASGEDLDRYAFDQYTLTRKGASPAVGEVRFFRQTLVGGAGSIPSGTRLKTLVGTEYITTTVASLGASDLQTTAKVRAAQAGKATQVGTNQIRLFSQPTLLFDKTLSVTNDLTTAGGEDDEDDETFRNRIRQFWTTVRRGVLSAIEFGALTVPGIVSAQAVEALTVFGDQAEPARVVNLYISDSSGVANAELAETVKQALLDYRACGIAVLVSPSVPFLVDVALSLTFQAGVDTVNLTESVKSAIFEFINSLPVNGPLYVAELNSVLQRFKGDGLLVVTNPSQPAASSVQAPVGDIVPEVGFTLRITIDRITTVTP